MIDFENEFLKIKKIAYQLTEKTYGKLVAELHMAGFDQQKELFEMFFKSGAESKQAEINSLKAQLAKVESGEFVVVPKDQLYQWGHMANYAQEYGCPECFEARGYAHSLACEINEYLKPVDAAQENSHE